MSECFARQRCRKKPEGDFRSNFSPIEGVGCTAHIRVSDTRCGTCVILPAFLQSRGSPISLVETDVQLHLQAINIQLSA
jgi:hypothetical protein